MILAYLDTNDDGLTRASRELENRCKGCWSALVFHLVRYAAMGFELVDFDEAQAADAPGHRPNVFRRNTGIALVTRMSGRALDTETHP